LRSARVSGQTTASTAAAVISASTNQSVMASIHRLEFGFPEAPPPGRIASAYR
jgi:hypothetical protein